VGLADRSAGAFALVVASDAAIRLGLRANWRQFALLVAVNAFVGAMVGLERAILPVLGEQEFGVASRAALLTFIASFGATKALTNLAAGALADRVGRKQLLIAGWLIGLPVPVLIILAPTWEWVVAANLLLGVNQGLCWSMTVIMKVDLVGPARRGLALGINEFASERLKGCEGAFLVNAHQAAVASHIRGKNSCQAAFHLTRSLGSREQNHRSLYSIPLVTTR
jgi:MFS family permease